MLAGQLNIAHLRPFAAVRIHGDEHQLFSRLLKRIIREVAQGSLFPVDSGPGAQYPRSRQPDSVRFVYRPRSVEHRGGALQDALLDWKPTPFLSEVGQLRRRHSEICSLLASWVKVRTLFSSWPFRKDNSERVRTPQELHSHHRTLSSLRAWVKVLPGPVKFTRNRAGSTVQCNFCMHYPSTCFTT